MKRFRFSLEAVLKWKRLQEEEALKGLGLAMQARQLAHERWLQARHQISELMKSIQEARQNRMSGSLQVAYLSEVGRWEAICQGKETLLKEAIHLEGIAREQYLKKKRETDAMLKLRGKREEIYVKEAGVRQEKELEEIMLSKR